MFTKRDHFSSASQSTLENQMDLTTQLGSTLLESTQKFCSLQNRYLKLSLDAMQELLHQVFSVTIPQQLPSVPVAHIKPVSTKAAAYGCQLAGIAVATQAELTDLLGTQINQTSSEITRLAEDIGKSLPNGVSWGMHSMQTILEQATIGCEQLTQASKHALNLVEANLSVAANQFERATMHAV